ncbi:MAG: hypothetical protein O7J95_18450, partial [Planctomycetota bacterium]|nr:hypothetical protein [Planctomycetota bacterium]
MVVVFSRRILVAVLLVGWTLAGSALHGQVAVKGYSTQLKLDPIEPGVNQTLTGWGAPDGPGIYVELFRVAQSGAHESVRSVAVDPGGVFSFSGVDVAVGGEHYYVTLSRSWHFNTDGDAEGWNQSVSDGLIEVSAGTLKVTVQDLNLDGFRDTYFHNYFEHDPQYYRVLEVRLRNPAAPSSAASERLGVYWGQPWTRTINLHSAGIPSEMTGFETVLIPLNVAEISITPAFGADVDGLWFSGNLNNTIRLDPFDGLPRFDSSLDGTVFEIDMIRMREDFRMEFDHSDDVMGLGMTADLQGLVVADGFFSYQSVGSPFLVYDLLSGKLESGHFTRFVAGVDFGPAAQPDSIGVRFNDDDSGDTYTDDGGNDQEATIPLAGGGRQDVAAFLDQFTQPAGEWTEDGRVPVQGLRFNVPKNGTNGEVVRIDYIGFTSANPFGPSDPVSVAVPNNPPVASVQTFPDPAVVTLRGDSAEVVLDGSGSHDGDGGTQGLSFSWVKVSGPENSHVGQDTAVLTVYFSTDGDYVYRLTVDDGVGFDSTASVDVAVTVNAPTFLRGDSDANGRSLEVSDAIHTASYLLDDRQPVELVCLDAADANDSGTVDISDVIFTLRYHYRGDAPSSAFPGCDSDPTSDAL